MTLSLRDRNTRRLLDTTVGGYFGVAMTYSRGPETLFEGKGRITVNDAEQNLDGSALEVDLVGYNLRLRRYLMPEGFDPVLGDLVTLAAPFMDHTVFNVDARGHAFGRGGDQILIGLTPAPANAPLGETEAQNPPRGRNLG